MNRHIIIFLVLLLLLIPVLGCKDEPTAVPSPRYSETADTSFAVGNSSTLTVDNFVGSVNVHTGATGIMQVKTTKWAKRRGDLGLIEVDIIEVQGGVRIMTENPSGVDDASVDLEITVPPDTQPTLHNGVGSLSYEGRPEGNFHFETGVGSITLNLAADINVEVELMVGVGNIYVAFPVNGLVGRRAVYGTIGTGLDGEIRAHVGVGNIAVNRQ